MNPVATFAPHIDVSTRNGYGAILRLLLRRHESVQVTPPVGILLNGIYGVVVQHAPDDLAAVEEWARALGLPVPHLGGSQVTAVSYDPGTPWQVYGTKGVCYRIRIEVWCTSRDTAYAAENFITDTDQRKQA
jgi:hypothetical protein